MDLNLRSRKLCVTSPKIFIGAIYLEKKQIAWQNTHLSKRVNHNLRSIKLCVTSSPSPKASLSLYKNCIINRKMNVLTINYQSIKYSPRVFSRQKVLNAQMQATHLNSKSYKRVCGDRFFCSH